MYHSESLISDNSFDIFLRFFNHKIFCNRQYFLTINDSQIQYKEIVSIYNTQHT